jgi:hypothetical protein
MLAAIDIAGNGREKKLKKHPTTPQLLAGGDMVVATWQSTRASCFACFVLSYGR